MVPSAGSIYAEGLWKRFRADLTKPMLRDQMSRLADWARRRSGGWTWVLRDVDVHVAPGESVGLIGINGSGKSTLLKVLCRVMYPTVGRVGIGGRIGAMIEVQGGIQPMLTARENIYVQATTLGLSRRQVNERFDTIVEFAELTDAVDRQVKYYSSGMGMRLGFSIAAFLDPDVLLVDEVLAVGDIDFQQRCLERMREVKQSGTTLVFVSHDMSAVEAMCDRCLWMDHGIVAAEGPTVEVIRSYRSGLEQKALQWAAEMDDPVKVTSATAYDPEGRDRPVAGGPAVIDLTFEAEHSQEFDLTVGVTEGPGLPIFVVNRQIALPAGRSRHQCRVEALPLPRGRYSLWAGGFVPRGQRPPIGWHPCGFFEVDGAERPKNFGIMMPSPVYTSTTWTSA